MFSHLESTVYGKWNIFPKVSAPGLVMLAFALFGTFAVAMAQTEEIQVYDAEIEDQGKFNP